MDNQASSITLEQFQQTVQAIEGEIGKVIVGQEELVRNVLIAIITGGHVLLEGVPGLGKTLLIRTLSQALELQFNRVQFTPDLMPADIIGTELLQVDDSGKRHFKFRPGPVFVNLLLADEVNRATPKTQSAMLQVMQEKMITVAGHTYTLKPPFFVLATQNPLEMEGTYPLPEAQLDRFMFKLDVRFPNLTELVEILERTTSENQPEAQTATDGEMLINMGQLARQIPVASHIKSYVAKILLATHPSQLDSPDMVKRYVRFGASPRGAQAMILGAKVNALFNNRYNVAFSDVQAVIHAALRHRLILNFEGEAGGIKIDDIVTSIAETVKRE
ncbi:MoxR family ATPase [Anaerolineales bacterium HSG24]|nr:MoxR family ATPase [Anaerolineales bacterium HSG24]